MNEQSVTSTPGSRGFDWRANIEIARPDYWLKNVFVIPGIIIALGTVTGIDARDLAGRIIVGFYRDLPHRVQPLHPERGAGRAFGSASPGEAKPRHTVRSSASRGSIRAVAHPLQPGHGFGARITIPFAPMLQALWIMAVIYDVPPMRSKTSHTSTSCPRRSITRFMLAGWFMVIGDHRAGLLLLSYWMIGCYFMALRRYAELLALNDRSTAGSYRRSFACYTPERLVVSSCSIPRGRCSSSAPFACAIGWSSFSRSRSWRWSWRCYLRVALKPQSAA